MPLTIIRGDEPITQEDLKAHLAALLRLENIGFFLGSGASVGPGGKTISQLWLDFWVYAESCGLILAFLGSGGRNAATIFSLRYSSSR